LTGIGSQYLVNMSDSKGEYFGGAKTYKVTLPKDIPAEKFYKGRSSSFASTARWNPCSRRNGGRVISRW
jgi:hypothetical protein